MDASYQAKNISELMRWVLIALMPGIGIYIYLTGWGGVINLFIAAITGVLFEALALHLRRKPVIPTLTDHSALVTVTLLALCLPPLMPWWIIVIAVAAAILLAKHAYGGLGQNVFNPAMVGYAVVLISYPLDVSTWVSMPEAFDLSFSQTLSLVFGGGLSQSVSYDALTGATALSQHYELGIQAATPEVIRDTVKGHLGARNSEWLNVSFLIGGLMLLLLRIISWHLPVALLSGIYISDLLLGSQYPDIFFHWLGGGTMICAFFIITDPVSAPASNRARLVYGFTAGVLIYLIRHYGSYPDSIAFAVLLLNCCVPLIDRIDNAVRNR